MSFNICVYIPPFMFWAYGQALGYKLKAWGFGTDPRATFACAGAAQMPVRRGSFHRMKHQEVFPFSVSGGGGLVQSSLRPLWLDAFFLHFFRYQFLSVEFNMCCFWVSIFDRFLLFFCNFQWSRSFFGNPAPVQAGAPKTRIRGYENGTRIE